MEQMTLAGNIAIPQIGLGTYDLKEAEIGSGLEAGYRLLDTAWQYGNEKEVGKAVKASGIKREELFITTKLWTEDIRLGKVREELEESLRNLQMEYVDLYLIHWPAEKFEAAWAEMVKLKEEGKIRAIGVSNFQIRHFKQLMQASEIVPILNQAEYHPYFQNRDIVSYCAKNRIAVQAWCPLGGSYANFTKKEVFTLLADKYGKTPAQIILRWHIQKGMLAIPRSSDRNRQKENLDVFSFRLLPEDMKIIDMLDTGQRIGPGPDNFQF